MENLTIEEIKAIIEATPNDMELGTKLRALFN